jgi:hypothetical protein
MREYSSSPTRKAEVTTVNTIGLYVCEICGTQSMDHAGWFTVAGAGPSMEVFPWNDELRARPDCRHACCGDHVQRLVFNSATQDLVSPMVSVAIPRGGWNPLSLVPPSADKPAVQDSFMSVLDAIDAALQGPTSEEEDTAGAFDA